MGAEGGMPGLQTGFLLAVFLGSLDSLPFWQQLAWADSQSGFDFPENVSVHMDPESSEIVTETE